MLEQKVTVTVETMNVQEDHIYGLLRVNGIHKYYYADNTILNGVIFGVEDILDGDTYKDTLNNLSVESVQEAIRRYKSQLQ